ncbi:MAG: hypothetical protein R3C11_01125 [Planctomycetaceae bacterium]
MYVISEERGDLELETIGTQVPSDISEVISGWEEARPNPNFPDQVYFVDRKTCKYNYTRETRWLGWRPFRYPGWEATIPLDKNPTSIMEKYYIPIYSFHTPAEVQKLYEEAQEYEDVFNACSDEVLVEMFNSDYLDGLEVAARNKLGLFCWLND